MRPLSALLMLAVCLAPEMVRASCPGFQIPVAVSFQGSRMAVADFDADGKSDVATAYADRNQLMIQRGNGDATFSTTATFTIMNPGPVITADFNGDGKPDLAVTTNTSVAVLMNTGGGTFRAPSFYGAGDMAITVVAADFNRDGKIDLAVGTATSIAVLLNNGSGAFAAAVSSPATGRVVSLAASEFNGDGRQDLAVAIDVGGVPAGSLLFGNGDGTFGAPVAMSGIGRVFEIAADDLNGDGISDLIVMGIRDVSVRLGNGDGTFGAWKSFSTGDRSYFPPHFGMALPDLNGDGKRDIIVANDLSDAISALIGNGDGTFQPEVRYSLGDPRQVATGDFDGDGKGDVLTEGAIFFGRGDGSFVGATALGVGAGAPQAIAAGDFNGDGLPDIAVLSYVSDAQPPSPLPLTDYSHVTVYLGQHGSTFGSMSQYRVSPQGYDLVTADFNHDGRSDLATEEERGIKIYLSNADGTLASPRYFDLSPLVQNWLGSMVAADFNGDGNPDIAVASRNNHAIAILLGRGDGNFTPATPSTVSLGGDLPWALAAGDFNGDGKMDLAVGNSVFGNDAASVVSVFAGNGDGSFAAPVNYPLGARPFGVLATDINGDGKVDLVVSKPDLDTISVFLGRGDGSFNSALDISVPYPTVLAAADFNGDGRADLFAGSLSILLGNADGTLAPAMTFDYGGSPTGFAVADFDNDGRADVAVSNHGLTGVNTSTAAIIMNSSTCASILSVDAKMGPPQGGQSVIVNGVSLAGAKSVTFGGAAASIKANTPTSIQVTTPAHTPGAVDVVVHTGGGPAASPLGYLYQSACPFIGIVSPWSLDAGVVGQTYTSAPMIARGGTAPYRFRISKGTIPPGLSFADGRFSGVPVAPGIFTFMVQAIDSAGCTGETVYSITVNNPSCLDMLPGTNVIPMFNGQQTGCNPTNRQACRISEAVAFWVTTPKYDMTCGSHVVGWDFGDGQQATGNHVTHAYLSAGTYEVTMTVTNPRQTIVFWTTTVVMAGRRRAAEH